MGRIRDLARNRVAVGIVRFFRLGFLFKFLYFRVFHPKGGTKTLEFKNIQAHFYALNYEDLNTLNTILTPGSMDERQTLTSLLDVLKPGDVALDIGAYHGLHTVFMAKKVGPRGKVIAVEPDPKNFEGLQANIRLNDIPQALAFQLALGDKVKVKSLFRSPKKTGGIVQSGRKNRKLFPQAGQGGHRRFFAEQPEPPGAKGGQDRCRGIRIPGATGAEKDTGQENDPPGLLRDPFASSSRLGDSRPDPGLA